MHNKNSENTMAIRTWTVPVEQDPGDPESLLLTFPDELLADAGWVAGDTLIWIVEENGSVTISKK
jgi:hypothetical protein